MVKFGSITSGISVVYRWYTSGKYLVVLPLFTMEIIAPLKSTVLLVVVRPSNFTADFHWYTTGIPLVIPETFSMGLNVQHSMS